MPMPTQAPGTELSSSSMEADEEAAVPENWVQCDRCNKWRRIPALLANSLEDNAAWYAPHVVQGLKVLASPPLLHLLTLPFTLQVL